MVRQYMLPKLVAAASLALTVSCNQLAVDPQVATVTVTTRWLTQVPADARLELTLYKTCGVDAPGQVKARATLPGGTLLPLTTTLKASEPLHTTACHSVVWVNGDIYRGDARLYRTHFADSNSWGTIRSDRFDALVELVPTTE